MPPLCCWSHQQNYTGASFPKAAGFLWWWCGMALALLKSILALVGAGVLLLQMSV